MTLSASLVAKFYTALQMRDNFKYTSKNKVKNPVIPWI